MANELERDLRGLIAWRRIRVIVRTGISIGTMRNAEAVSWFRLFRLVELRRRNPIL